MGENVIDGINKALKVIKHCFNNEQDYRKKLIVSLAEQQEGTRKHAHIGLEIIRSEERMYALWNAYRSVREQL